MSNWIGIPPARSAGAWRKQLFLEGQSLAKRGKPCPKHPSARRGWIFGPGDIYEFRMAGYASLRCGKPGPTAAQP